MWARIASRQFGATSLLGTGSSSVSGRRTPPSRSASPDRSTIGRGDRHLVEVVSFSRSSRYWCRSESDISRTSGAECTEGVYATRGEEGCQIRGMVGDMNVLMSVGGRGECDVGVDESL